MKTRLRIVVVLALTAALSTSLSLPVKAQAFIHPGINQSLKDLAYMKKMVLQAQQPWKAAFDRLKAAADTAFVVQPHAHVLRGPYGKPNVGGDDLSRAASMAYNDALVWYITNDKTYADKAIAILNAWPPVLWDFDYNDAKLLAGWTGHLLCNAAEILRYTPSGWQQKDIGSFTGMLMTVYYPLMRYYYPQANGNWDGAIIHSIMAIAIFADDRNMFNNAVAHFLHAPVNGSIFKYIFPSGQCQESMRDQGHVQLGLGEFAGAAQVAYTQGVDLFSIGNNRIALGYEYTARFLMGEKPYCYGPISERAKNLRDDYEYVYRHYTSRGVEMPYTKMAADSVRPKASRSILTALRAPDHKENQALTRVTVSNIGYIAGAGAAASTSFPTDAIIVMPGQPVQQALDAAAGAGKWVVVKSGLHTLPATLKMPAGITLCGEGPGSILFLDPASGQREAIVNADSNMHDVAIRDLVIEGALKVEVPSDPNSSRSYRGGYNRGGILFRSEREGQMKNIDLTRITVQNCTYSGVSITGASGIHITRCDLTENGATAIPGPRLVHNLLLTHCSNIDIKDSRFDTSPNGSGVALLNCSDASVNACEIARNGYYGAFVSESRNISLKGNLIEGNDHSGVMLEFLRNGSSNVTVSNNLVHFNGGYGVESYAAQNSKIVNNAYAGNGNNTIQQKISSEKFIIME